MRLPRFCLIVLLTSSMFVPFAKGAELVEQITAAPIPWEKQPGYITCAARDPATGELWVGTETAGLWSYDGKDWAQYTTHDGLGDDNVYAVAVDRQGRVWAGHLNHGVSVFNGQVWKSFDVNTGPLGARVFAMKVCPAGVGMGDVWIATECGLARWSPATDRWSYVTRAEGLPSDQVGCLAFDADGRVFAGTQCEGIAIASPADDYASWTTIPGPDRPTTAAMGDGLPSHFINDILINHDQIIYVATPWGMGKSTDRAKSFTYVRGDDWADKLQDRTAGPPAAAAAGAGNANAPLLMREDFLTCFAEDSAGLLWAGYRNRGYEVIDADGSLVYSGGDSADGKGTGHYITALLAIPDQAPLIGTYGDGLGQPDKFFKIAGAAPAPAPAGGRAAAPAFPSVASGPPPKAVDEMMARLKALKPTPLSAAFLGDDWETQGDGVGRYGKQQYSFPWYGSSGWAQGYKCGVKVGPHQENNSGGPYTYYHTVDTDAVRTLHLPNSGRRSQGEWNDGTFDRKAYPHWDTWEGPDLWLDITVPAGTQRISLYFVNYDGHGAYQRRRDFGVEVKAHAPTIAAADAAPALARTRVTNFYHGVYKQFLVAGPGTYFIKVDRNYSNVGKLSAVFFDRIAGAPPAGEPKGIPLLQENDIEPPAFQAKGDLNEHVALRAAFNVWTGLDEAWGRQEAAVLQKPYRLMALRLATSYDANGDWLANWRFVLPRMTPADHTSFVETMVRVRLKLNGQNPDAASSTFERSMHTAWEKLSKQIATGHAPTAASFTSAKKKLVDADEIEPALATYLQVQAGARIEKPEVTAGGSNPALFRDAIRVAADHANNATPALYAVAGRYLLASASFNCSSNAPGREAGLACAIAATEAASELLKDPWLAAHAADAFLLPNLKHASADPASPVSRPAVLAAIVAAHNGDPASTAALLKRLVDSAEGADAANTLRYDIAAALHTLGLNKEAGEYLLEINPHQRTREAETLLKAVQ